MLYLYMAPLMISAMLGIFLVIFISRNRPAPGSRALRLLILATCVWTIGYALEFLSPDIDAMLFWARFQYFGIATVPLAWFVFVTQYLGASGWPARLLRYRALLAVIPLITLGLVWTNDLHGLVWRQVSLQALGPVFILGIRHGPWFWLQLLFGYSLMLGGTVRMMVGLLGSLRLHRWQIILALTGSLLPWLGNLVYISGINPVENLDWTPFAFTISGLLFTVSLFRFQLVNILPIAQKTVFAELSDCLLVLDMQDRIVELNTAAARRFGRPGRELAGKPVGQVLPELAGWLSQAGFVEEFQADISIGEDPQRRYYDLRIKPLVGPYALQAGRLVTCHEITAHKQQQAVLEQAVAKRTEELRQAIVQLQHELVQRTLAEKQFKDVIEAAPDAMLLVDQAGVILLVNAQTERLFGYTRQELLGQKYEILITDHTRDSYRRFQEQYIAAPTIRQVSFGLGFSARHKDGSEFPVEVSLGPLNTEQGVSVACNIRDISKRLRAEQEKNQLLGELQHSHEQLSALTARLQEVQEFERRQIAAELHDRVGQNLTGLNLNLQIMENQLCSDCVTPIQHRLAVSLKLVEETTRQVRDVMAELHPPMLDEYGLVSALSWYSGNFSEWAGIAAHVKGLEFEPRLPPNVEMVLFRLVQEALNNVAKHARATEVVVTLESTPGGGCLKVEDNGLGFDLEALHAPAGQAHWGMLYMQQGAASIGGQLVVSSTREEGTKLCVNFGR